MRPFAISCGLAMALVGTTWLSGFSQPVSTPPSAPGDVQVHAVLLPNGTHQIVVVDTRQQSMALYHVVGTSGKIELKSVRKIQMDLAIEQFNASEPLPSEMRLLNARQ